MSTTVSQVTNETIAALPQAERDHVREYLLDALEPMARTLHVAVSAGILTEEQATRAYRHSGNAIIGTYLLGVLHGEGWHVEAVEEVIEGDTPTYALVAELIHWSSSLVTSLAFEVINHIKEEHGDG